MSGWGGQLTAALVAALKGDGAVAALVSTRVYDEVPRDGRGQPSDATPPWVFIGPVSGQRLEDGAHRMWMARARVYCADTSFNRARVWALADAVTAALELRTLDLGAAFEMNLALREEATGDVIDPVHPKMTFVDVTCVIARVSPLPGV